MAFHFDINGRYRDGIQNGLPPLPIS